VLTLVSNRRSELYWRLWLGGLLWKVLVIALGLVAANFLSEWSDTTWQMIGIGLLLFAMLLERGAARDTLARVDEILLGEMEAAEFLSERAPGTAGAFTLTGVPNAFDRLMDELLTAAAGPLSKEVDARGRTVYRTRGADPRGPAKGGGADTIDARMPRIDAMTPRPEFDDLEDELTRAEETVVEANLVAAERAEKRWKEQEKSDSELLEEGVEKLGDLVAKGHFGGPQESDETTENH
tara:strand:+ start:95 stop:808 length:714 start_codon:yes stop_codon:yes gene_type:complete